MAYFTQQLINAITLGAIYGLIAIGYTMVYGIIGMINFAHGEVFMIGAFISLIGFIICGSLGISSAPIAIVLVLLLAMSFSAVYGWAIERTAYRPLRGSFRLAPLISAIGVSIALQNYVQLAQGARPKPGGQVVSGGFNLFTADGFDVRVTWLQIIIVLVTVVLMAGFTWVIAKTSLGRQQRACEQDMKMASLLGRQRRPHHLAHLRAGRGAGRRRRHAVPDVLRRHRFLHRLPGRHQGLHRGGAGRHRLAAGRHAGRAADRPDRGLLGRLLLERIQGRRGLRDPRAGADLPAERPAWANRRSRRSERMGPRLPSHAEGRGPHCVRRRRARHLHRGLPHRRHGRRQGAGLRLSPRRSRRGDGRHLHRPARPLDGGDRPALARHRAGRRDDRGWRLADEAAVRLPALVRGAGRRAAGDPRDLAVGQRRDGRGGADAVGRGARQGRRQMVRLAAAGRRGPDAVHAVRRPEDDGSRRADPDLRDAGLGPQHRGRPRGPARPGLRRLLRRRRLRLCAAQHPVRAGLLDGPAARRDDGGAVRHHAGLPGPAAARRLSRHRDPGLRRDHPPGAAQLVRPHQRAGRHRLDSRARPCSARCSPRRRRPASRPCRRCWASPSTAITG